MKYPKILASSANAENLSLSIKGILIGILPMLILLSDSLGWGITENQFSDYVALFSQSIAYGCIIVGLMRKLFIALKKNSIK